MTVEQSLKIEPADEFEFLDNNNEVMLIRKNTIYQYKMC